MKRKTPAKDFRSWIGPPAPIVPTTRYGTGTGTHSFKGTSNSSGYGHDVTNRRGSARLSGNPGAHCIGKKK